MYQGRLAGDVDWTQVITGAISTAGQLIKPTTYQSTAPVYSPASVTGLPGVGYIPTWMLVAGGVGLLLLLKRR